MDFNYKGVMECILLVLVLSLLVGFTINTGCITAAKNTGRELMKTPTPTPTPLPTPTPTPTPTPIPTPTAIPTIDPHYVDPYVHGERWEGQWFKWLRQDVVGLQDMHVGIVVYRHVWLDGYTWWNGAMGNYYRQEPNPGYRYLAVFIHEEMFGDNQTYDPRMWVFDDNAFRVQYNEKIYSTNLEYNPVNLIKELDYQYNYYNTEKAWPFGHQRIYTGHNPETAGWVSQDIGYLRMGKGNAIDGYILYEIPKDAKDKEVMLLGSFSRFGSAYWRLGE